MSINIYNNNRNKFKRKKKPSLMVKNERGLFKKLKTELCVGLIAQKY